MFKASFSGDAFPVFAALGHRQRLCFLDSGLKGSDGGHSLIAFSPRASICGHGLGALKKRFERAPWRSADCRQAAVGSISYDGDYRFAFYDNTIWFDHKAGSVAVTAATERQLEGLRAWMRQPSVKPGPLPRVRLRFRSHMTQRGYIAAVRKALHHIRQGDIYQINVSRMVEAKLPGTFTKDHALRLYAALRRRSPSDFCAYCDDGRTIILSSSPERFLKVDGRTVQVKPMKGTRPRGKTSAEDRSLRRELEESAKEKAELLMVTDLERNDLGRVCSYGSIRVIRMREIEEYATVFQATATIEGQLHRGFNGFDAMQAAFPGGSVTGCPKIEAMNIIHRLEGRPRGLYTGALGYVRPNGNMDFSMVIRSVLIGQGAIRFHVGSGIVADSDPQAEYDETVLKAAAMEAAIQEVLG